MLIQLRRFSLLPNGDETESEGFLNPGQIGVFLVKDLGVFLFLFSTMKMEKPCLMQNSPVSLLSELQKKELMHGSLYQKKNFFKGLIFLMIGKENLCERGLIHWMFGLILVVVTELFSNELKT